MFTSLSTLYKFLISFNYTTTAIFTSHLRHYTVITSSNLISDKNTVGVCSYRFFKHCHSVDNSFSRSYYASMASYRYTACQLFLHSCAVRHYMKDACRCQHCCPVTNETRLSRRCAKTKNNCFSDRTSTTQGPAPHTL